MSRWRFLATEGSEGLPRLGNCNPTASLRLFRLAVHISKAVGARFAFGFA